MKIQGIVVVVLLLSLSGFSGAQQEGIETRVYEVPRNFLENVPRLFSSGLDILDDDVSNYDSKTGRVTATLSESQFTILENFLDQIVSESERRIFTVHERIEVDHFDFSDWLLENRLDHDGTELRKTVQGWAEQDRATILGTATISVRPGQRGKAESGKEYIYPTEPGVPELPNQLKLSGNAEAPIVSRIPSAFETRNIGNLLEVDTVLGHDDVTVGLNLMPQTVDLKEVIRIQAEPEGNFSSVDMPIFYTQKITTQVSLLTGRYIFLGTTQPLESSDPERKNPLVLNFVRADVGTVAEWSRVK